MRRALKRAESVFGENPEIKQRILSAIRNIKQGQLLSETPFCNPREANLAKHARLQLMGGHYRLN